MTKPKYPHKGHEWDELIEFLYAAKDREWAAAVKRVHAGYNLKNYVKDRFRRTRDAVIAVGILTSLTLALVTGQEEMAIVSTCAVALVMFMWFVVSWEEW